MKRKIICVLLALAMALAVPLAHAEDLEELPEAVEEEAPVPPEEEETEASTEEEELPPPAEEETQPAEVEPTEATEPPTEPPTEAEPPTEPSTEEPTEEPSEEEDPAEEPTGETSEEEGPTEEAPEEDPEEPEEEELQPAAEDVIYVSVPASGRMVVNPYGLEVSVDGETSHDQVVSGTYELVNYSDIAVTVSAQAVGTAGWGSEAALVPYPPALDAPEKEIFLFAEFRTAWDGPWSGVYTGARNQVPADGRWYPDVMDLEAGETGLFRIFGVASRPADRLWTAEDTVSVTLAFTFQPLYTPQAWEMGWDTNWE